MNTIRLDDELFTLTQAAHFLQKSPRTVRQLIKSHRLRAGKSGQNGGGNFEILKSACLEYIDNNQHNQAVNAEDGLIERTTRWHLNRGTANTGTVISLRRGVEKELGAALKRQIKNKRRSCTIS
ncbi:helix-turn-helix domain-containing protein [Candidatus Fukatsuia endosymbiont of Tuberolachnus salignus]|uniref:helix-turn-helix domain-containing protein n=1 Tax=Candidatus Fukatsuia endosymbiont of Tuberolachnus salignus TaxID=3077957 RepID=UPI003CC7ACBA